MMFGFQKVRELGAIALACLFGWFAFKILPSTEPTSTEWAAWVQAVGSVGAIGVAIWLQSRDRRIRQNDLRRSQVAALSAMAERCVETLQQVDTLARTRTLTTAWIGRLRDEIAADEMALTKVDMASFGAVEAIDHLSILLREVRAAGRKVKYAGNTLKNEGKVAPDRFAEHLSIACRCLVALRALRDVDPSKVLMKDGFRPYR